MNIWTKFYLLVIAMSFAASLLLVAFFYLTFTIFYKIAVIVKPQKKVEGEISEPPASGTEEIPPNVLPTETAENNFVFDHEVCDKWSARKNFSSTEDTKSCNSCAFYKPYISKYGGSEVLPFGECTNEVFLSKNIKSYEPESETSVKKKSKFGLVVKFSFLYVMIFTTLLSLHFVFLKNPAVFYFGQKKKAKQETLWHPEDNLTRIISNERKTFPLPNRLRNIDSPVDEYISQPVIEPTSGNNANLESVSLKGKIILIDPGHGDPNNPGSIGPTGLVENSVVLEVAKLLKILLEKDAAEVYLTREEISSDLSNKARGEYANKLKADLFLRIHADPAPDAQKNGFAVSWYKNNSKESAYIFEKYLKSTNRQSLGVFQVYSEGFDAADVPSISVDIAKISNSAEESLLKNKAFLKLTSDTLHKATKEFLINFSN